MAQDGMALIVTIKTEYWANLSDDGTPLRSGGQGECERTWSMWSATCGVLTFPEEKPGVNALYVAYVPESYGPYMWGTRAKIVVSFWSHKLR